MIRLCPGSVCTAAIVFFDLASMIEGKYQAIDKAVALFDETVAEAMNKAERPGVLVLFSVHDIPLVASSLNVARVRAIEFLTDVLLKIEGYGKADSRFTPDLRGYVWILLTSLAVLWQGDIIAQELAKERKITRVRFREPQSE